jgi:hypothetical protein
MNGKQTGGIAAGGLIVCHEAGVEMRITGTVR